MATLKIKNLSKTIGSTKILEDVNISANDGEFLILVGPSGSGKSTILRTIAGLETPSLGSIFIDNNDITACSPKDRDIAMVFQNYALYPHLSVFENIAFPLKMKKVDSSKIKELVEKTADLLGVKKYLTKKPRELSGGERQRVALGRAIIRNPKLFLMDEPLSNLDAKLRTHMRAELLSLHKTLKSTIIYVTHDQIEALTMGDRIVILNQGKVQQIGSPEEVYKSPVNIFVASFIGNPAMNFFDFKVLSANEVLLFDEKFIVTFPQNIYQSLLNHNLINKNLILGLRPEHLLVGEKSGLPMINGEIDLLEMLGSEYLVYVKGVKKSGKTNSFSLKVSDASGLTLGKNVKISFDFSNTHFFNADTSERIFL